YSKAIELEPRYAMAYINRGTVCLLQRKWKEAIRDYNQAIQVDPLNAEAYLNRGLAMLLTGNTPSADQDFAQCLRLAGVRRETFEKQIERIRQQVAGKPRQ